MLEIGVGFWCIQRNHSRPTPLPAMYRDTRTEMAAAERLGFDTVWVGEHHFAYDGYLPSPLSGLAFGATQLTTARPAAGVLVLPLHSPARVAAGLAALSDAGSTPPRVAFGLGYRDDELTSIGIPPAERLRVFVRHLDELLSGEHDEDLGAAQLWLGGTAEPMLARAARRGLPIVVPGSNSSRGVTRAVNVYREHLRARPGVMPQVGVIKEVWIEDDKRRLDEARERLKSMWRHYSMFWVNGEGNREDQREALVEGITGKAIMGSSQHVLDELVAYVEAGAETLACRVRYDSTDSGRVLENIERLATEVVPHLRKAS